MASVPPPMQVPGGALAAQSSTVSAGTLFTGCQLSPALTVLNQEPPPPTAAQIEPEQPIAASAVVPVVMRRQSLEPRLWVTIARPAGCAPMPTQVPGLGQA